MPRGKAKKNEDCGQFLREEQLGDYTGGLSAGFTDLLRMRVKCPVEGCNFECNTFGEMNIHMHENHPERC